VCADPVQRSLIVSAPNTLLTNDSRGPAIGERGRGHRSNYLRHGNLAGEMVVHADTVTTITAEHGAAVGVVAAMSRCRGRAGASLSGRGRLLQEGPPDGPAVRECGRTRKRATHPRTVARHSG
jgi:hypothetical protein